MNSLKKSGKTYEDALESALLELGLTEQEVDIEIIEEGKKGLFGLGNKDVVINVKPKENPAKYAREFLDGILKKMGIYAYFTIDKREDSLDINIEGENMGLIIGHRGETLNALQYLTTLAVNKSTDKYVRISLDTENYKQKRTETLKKLAHRVANRVIKFKKGITLEPMNPYERRIIHSTLQNNKLITTYSVGDEPNRKVVIDLMDKKYKGKQ